VERFRNTFVMTWIGVVVIGIPIFGGGFVWPWIFVAIAYCVIDALFGVAKNRRAGGAQTSKNANNQDEQKHGT
jgi:hypothetical protein